MSTCAVMLVKDEADIIEHTVRWLLTQVDEILIADNMSTDGTLEILRNMFNNTPEIRLAADDEPGHYQGRKTTALAMNALSRGHDWVLPCDADEIWYHAGGERIADVLASLPEHEQFAAARLLNHMPTGKDGYDPDPVKRICWRVLEPGRLPKVACRLERDLQIHEGNHSATLSGRVHSDYSATAHVLTIRHFSWRTADQYVRKIRNGVNAFAAAPDIAEQYGAHWRMHGDPSDPTFDQRVREHFYSWFWADDPDQRDDLVYDPAPTL